mmetsp:Transcript_26057/g.87292  ORF Transcript_26057/g.87292 Transcript_26057/m.87292 type:complete len:244 (-) Transcript_26057:84-815(-)|eukprot:CAMPEP_0205999546 /NCGR_PEP_ID=MMETSP1464-20131121/911_1 /ASSEMBLY_ACC=CAM_ASM_001124 /TAXON_ID=119497 /ORGANISM="Exanthemachrysis gayraliae, Strain RCC1523" /LENGTH=243 /DNA_ID=CAMNT_0053372753 /DNA_START=251 /DNA_END=982 /DNA_ORIENTATION=+
MLRSRSPADVAVRSATSSPHTARALRRLARGSQGRGDNDGRHDHRGGGSDHGADGHPQLCLVPEVEALGARRVLLKLLGKHAHLLGLLLEGLQAVVLGEHGLDVVVHDLLHLVHLLAEHGHPPLGVGCLHPLLEGGRERLPAEVRPRVEEGVVQDRPDEEGDFFQVSLGHQPLQIPGVHAEEGHGGRTSVEDHGQLEAPQAGPCMKSQPGVVFRAARFVARCSTCEDGDSPSAHASQMSVMSR